MKLPDPSPAALNEEPSVASATRALRAGALLDEFEVGEIIGEGSATIVYAATDCAGAVPVAIAEYIPARLARRNHAAQVTPRTSAQADAFAKGLKAFINESRTLARCAHPSLVRVARLWEANGTAYRLMPRYPARRLLEVRRSMSEPPDEETVRALLDALLGALEAFHHAGGGHGKVTPSNILLLADERPLLLGPGAAGRAIAGDRIDALTSGEPCFAPIEQMVESADIPLRPSVDLYALANVARYWISGELPAPVFGAARTPRRERVADTVQRLRLTWPRLHYSASLVDALDSALSIYPAERPQSGAQMRARLDIAPPAAGGAVTAASTAAAVPIDAAPSPAEPVSRPSEAPEPAPVTQDRDAPVAFSPDPEPPATSGVARIDVDPSVRSAFARQAPKPRRIAPWIGAVLVLAALLVIGMDEFPLERQVGRVLDVLGISRGTGAGDSAAESASAVAPAGPVTPPIATDAGGANPTPAETSAADSSATAPASPASAPIAANAGSTNPTPTETTAAESSSATAPTSPASAPIGANAGAANPTPIETSAADSTPSATAPESPASPNRSTPAAATAAPAEPTAVAQRPARAQPPARVAQQHALRAPASPREVCGPRTQFSLYRCMKTQCSQRRWASHAQCVRLRITDSVD